MIENLLKLKKITQEQFEIYMTFEVNEFGRNMFHRMIYAYLLDVPPMEVVDEAKCVAFVGRCALLKDWHSTILFVKSKIKELENV